MTTFFSKPFHLPCPSPHSHDLLSSPTTSASTAGNSMEVDHSGVDGAATHHVSASLELRCCGQDDGGNSCIGEAQHHYVVILTDGAKYALLHPTRQGKLGLARFFSLYAPTTTFQYLSDFSTHFGISGGVHLVEDIQFQEPEGTRCHEGSLVIVEVEDGGYCECERFEMVEVKSLLQCNGILCGCPLALSYLRSFLTGSNDVAKKREFLPWYSTGFYQKVISSVDGCLSGAGYVMPGGLRQFRFSYRSVVYRVSTATGNVFVKYIPRGNKEISKTSVITRCLPEVTASSICIDAKLNALFTLDFGGSLSSICFVPHVRTPAAGYENREAISRLVLRQWARTQQESTAHIVDFVAGGVPVYDEGWIRKGLRNVQAFAEKRLSSVPGMAEKLLLCEFYIECVFRAWEEVKLPMTLVHGDLNETNISQPGGPGTSFLFFDWDSAFIGHPFLDLLSTEFHPLFQGEPAFIEAWANYSAHSRTALRKLASWTKPVQYLVSAIMEMEDASLPESIRKSLVRINLNDFIESVCFRSLNIAEAGEDHIE